MSQTTKDEARVGHTHTPGPWAWYLDDNGIDLRTPHSGQLLVMDYGSAVTRRPVLRFAERTDRMGGLMQAAHNLITTKHSRPGFVEIDNPDARLIAAAPDLRHSAGVVIEAVANGPQGEILRSDPATWNPEAHIELTLTAAEVFALRAALAKAGATP